MLEIELKKAASGVSSWSPQSREGDRPVTRQGRRHRLRGHGWDRGGTGDWGSPGDLPSSADGVSGRASWKRAFLV